jgi:hypothetical protein
MSAQSGEVLGLTPAQAATTCPRQGVPRTTHPRLRAAALALFVSVVACGESSSVPMLPYGASNSLRTGASFAFEALLPLDGDFGKVGPVAVDESQRVYVADVMRREIIVFDSLGKRQRVLGRRGEGPGEFQFLNAMTIRDDTLYVFDLGQRRITLFAVTDDSLPLARTVPVFAQGRHTVKDVFIGPEQRYYLWIRPPELTANTVTVGDGTVLIADGEGRLVADSVMSLKGPEWLITRVGDGYAVQEMPFGKRTFVEIGSDGRLYTFWSGEGQLRVYDPDGTHLTVIPLPDLTNRRLDAGDINILRESILEPGGALARRKVEWLDAAVEDGVIPSLFPSVAQLVMDERDRLWIEPVGLAHRVRSTSFGLALEASGGGMDLMMVDLSDGWYANGRLPSAGRLAAVRDGRVYTVRSDDLGVESVMVYRIAMEGH